MDKWEYKVVTLMKPMKEDDINKLGADGWELVEIVIYSALAQWYYFKRRKA